MVPNVKEDHYFRGIFMTLFADIEFILGEILAGILVKEKEDKITLMEFINPSFVFDKKISVTIHFLKRRHHVIFDKYQDSLNILRELGELRNDFAHKRIEIDLINHTLYFIKMNNGNVHKDPHTFVKLDEKFEILKNMFEELTNLEKEVLNSR